MKQRYLTLSDDQYICDRAVLDCFDKKWKRNDVLSFIEKNAGIPRHEILLFDLEVQEDKALERDHPQKMEAVTSCALALEEMVCTILDGGEPEEMEPVKIRPRPEGMTGKVRDIALLCITHQLIEHVTFNLMEPMFRQKLYPTQFASIPGRGQTALKNHLNRLLRRKTGIRKARKTDMVQAYKSVKYEKVLSLVRQDIPSAHEIHALLAWLGRHAPGGCLIIGGYLDAWLFNYVMANVIREGYEAGYVRRGKFHRYAITIATYMDDMVILSASNKGLKAVIQRMSHYARDHLDMEMRTTTGVITFLPVKEERERCKSKKKAHRGCPVIDMGGYKICRGHVSIRRRVAVRVIRQFLRAWREYIRKGSISIQRARKIISYNSFLKQTDSQELRDKYHATTLLRLAERVASFHARIAERKRRAILYDLRERTEQHKALAGHGRGFAGWPAEGNRYKRCLGCIGRWKRDVRVQRGDLQPA